MATIDDLRLRVTELFAARPSELVGWADPHPDRQPADDEYSRLTNAERWRILGARADAWVASLVELGLATANAVDVTSVRWTSVPPTSVTSIVSVEPSAAGAVTLLVGRSRLGDVEDAGVTFSAGDPASVVEFRPDCGCDACDSGSQDELDCVDAFFASIVSGSFRRLTRGTETITAGVNDGLSWSSGAVAGRHLRRNEVEVILQNPTGWHEISGAAWM